MKINIPDDVELIIDRVQKNGFECYIVGGCVRDSILGLNPKDWDLTTNALPQEIINIFSDYTCLESGLKHGTITIVINKKPYEITTYRCDGEYLDNRHPDNVIFTKSIKDDLARRDFTVNAMAYNREKGIVDCFDGQNDLKFKAIRCVGEPQKRFEEDSLRILRGLRFASVYNFTIEANTSNAIIKNKQLLKNISEERISCELLQLICGENAGYILRRYKEVFAVIIPQIEVMFDFDQNTPHHNKTLWKHVVSSINHIEQDPVLRMTMLLHDIGKPQTLSTDKKGVSHFYGHQMLSAEMAHTILKNLKLSNEFIDNVVTLIKYHDERFNGNPKHIKRVMSKIGEVQFFRLLKVQRADMLAQSFYKREEKVLSLVSTEKAFNEILDNQECFSLKNLAINGKDIIHLGVTNGKKIGETLQTLLDLVIDNQIENNREILLQKAKEINSLI